MVHRLQAKTLIHIKLIYMFKVLFQSFTNISLMLYLVQQLCLLDTLCTNIRTAGVCDRELVSDAS